MDVWSGDVDVLFGDSGEFGGDADVVDEFVPSGVVARVAVEFMLESVCLVTPHGASRGSGGDGSEDVEVEVLRVGSELRDALDAGVVEGVVELSDAAAEGATVGSGRVERLSASLLVTFEIVEAMPGFGLAMRAVGEVLVCGVDFVGAACDGSVVAARPSTAGVLLEFCLCSVEATLRGDPVVGGGAEIVAGGVAVKPSVGRDGRVERGELLAEVLSGDA